MNDNISGFNLALEKVTIQTQAIEAIRKIQASHSATIKALRNHQTSHTSTIEAVSKNQDLIEKNVVSIEQQ